MDYTYAKTLFMVYLKLGVPCFFLAVLEVARTLGTLGDYTLHYGQSILDRSSY